MVRPIITFATGNAGKLRELQSMAPDGLEFTSAKLDLEEIQDFDTKVILEHKLRHAFQLVGGPVICEDVAAGLESLNGLPGPFIRFFEDRLGQDALYKLSKAPNDKVTVLCVAGYFDGQELLFGEGYLHGTITAPRGDQGFGFDPVIIPNDQANGQQRTMAEMTTDEKNAISHRGQAFRALLQQLSN
jgi:non-canonical purine NTP pyrophosphatase (RdgB/HAM1 family)